MKACNAPLASRSLPVRATALAALLACLAPQVFAVPSQTPLVQRPESKPKPNLVLTFDDSGSMNSQFVPEGAFKVNGYDLSFPDGRVFLYPGEISRNIFSRYSKTTLPASDTRFVTAVPEDKMASEFSTNATKFKAQKLLQYQMRSPQVNKLYYNPRYHYAPWVGVRGSSIPTSASGQQAGDTYSFGEATFTGANLDPFGLDDETSTNRESDPYKFPVDTTSVVDLSKITTFKAPWLASDLSSADNTTKTYNPALIYLLAAGADPNSTSNYTLIDLNDGSTTVTYGTATDYDARIQAGDCTKTSDTKVTCSIKAEKQNFANWFVFYRSRLLAAQGAVPAALDAIDDRLRFGWGTLRAGVTFDATTRYANTTLGSGDYSFDLNADGTPQTSKTVQQGVQNWTPTRKRAFTQWLRSLQTWEGTLTRESVDSVGKYYMTSAPWKADPATDSGVELSCRRAYHMMITDGYYYNDKPDAIGNFDGDSNQVSADRLGADATLNPEGAPFRDGASNTLADYAMKYWATDLRPGVDNNVATITVTPAENATDAQKVLAQVKGDPATWQHVNQFFLGFGTTGKALQASDLVDDTTYDLAVQRIITNCSAGSTSSGCWSSAKTPTSAEKIDELWHAAISTRGRYYNVNNVDEVKRAIDATLSTINAAAFKEGGVATAGTALQTGNLMFVPEYVAQAWTGDLSAYTLTLNASGQPTWSLVWQAATQLPSAAQRNVRVGSLLNGTWTDVPFVASTSAGVTSTFGVDNTVINFVRGDTSNKSLRTRAGSLLPDFVNSSPLYVGKGIDRGYSAGSDTSASSYASYLSAKQSRSNGLVFLGGNGGMLHAFQSNDGSETFAFVPQASLTNLWRLADPNYGSSLNYHRYFVDGQLNEADVYLGSQWRNIVVGAMGAGGTGLFALALNTSNVVSAASVSLLWDDTNSADAGYITSTPQVGRLPDGSWKVFSGNGVDSADGTPELLVIDAASGAISKVPVSPGGTVHGGLGGVALVKDANNGNVRAVYAGDTAGHLWRFDVSEGSSSAVSVGYDGQAIMTATDDSAANAAQPILAAPVVFSHPRGGQVVVFNTGKLIDDTDATDEQPQTIYGVWDKQAFGASTAGMSPPTVTPRGAGTGTAAGNMLQQSISRVTLDQSDGSTADFLMLDGTDKIDWGTQMGWMLDLKIPQSSTSTGSYFYPKAIYDPQLFGRSVLIGAVTPGNTEEACTATAAQGYAFLLKALTGATSTVPAIDTNGDGLVDSNDQIGAVGFVFPGGRQTILTKDSPSGGGDDGCLEGSDQYADGSKAIRDCGGSRIRDRVWRQLINPPH